MDRDQLLHELSSLKEELILKYNITGLAVFGSYSRNEHDENSDVDIVVFSEDKNYFKLIEMENYLSEKLNMNIDLGYIDGMKSYIKKKIQEEMIHV